MLSKLIENNMQHLIPLSVGELRKMCADLKLQDGNKDEMVGNIFSVLVNRDQSGENTVVLFDNCIDLDIYLM